MSLLTQILEKVTGSNIPSTSINGLLQKVYDLQSKVKQHDDILRNINENEIFKKFQEMREYVVHARKKVQIEVLKTTVVSEVSRMYPEVTFTAIKALEKVDPWWEKNHTRTIAEWCDIFTELKKEEMIVKKEADLTRKCPS